MQPTDSQRTTVQLRRVFRRHKPLVAISLVVFLAPALVYNQMATPTYEASTSMIFDEVAAPMPTPDNDMSRELQLANRLEELGSVAFAQDIARALPAEVRQRFEFGPTATDIDTLETITKVIHKNMTAHPLRNSNVVEIAVQLHDPGLATIVANTAAAVFQERNFRIKSQGVGGVRAFIEGQLAKFQAQLDSTEKALRDYKERNKITSFDSEAQEVLRRATEAEVLYNAAVANRNSQDERLATIQRELAQQKRELVPAVTELASTRARRLKDKLADLEGQYVELRVQNYPATHPKMVQLQQDIDETKKNLTAEAEKLAGGQSVADPIAEMEKYTTDVTSLQIEIESSRAQEAALKRVMRDYDARLGNLPEKEFNLARLTRERDVSHKIYAMLLEKLEEARLAEAEKIPSIRIIDTAVEPDAPIKPRKRLNLLLGAMLGLIGGTGLALVLESGRPSVESTLTLEKLTGWPVLASIPRIDRMSSTQLAQLAEAGQGGASSRRLKRGLVSLLEPNSAAAEAYRMLRTNLQFLGVGTRYRTLLVTSIGPSDGKSTTLANLGLTLAATDSKVLLVDAEVRRPVMHAIFDAVRAPGLSDVLMSLNGKSAPAAPAEAVERPASGRVWREENGTEAALAAEVSAENGAEQQLVEAFRHAVQTTRARNLDILATGVQVENPGDSVVNSASRLKLLLEGLKDEYAVVLVDSPPLMLVHDTALISRMVDGVIFVVNSNRFDPEMLIKAKRLLENAGAHVLGTVLNHIDPQGVYRYDKYYTA